MASKFHPTKAPVIDLFTGQVIGPRDDERLVRMSPEYDGTSMLYCNDVNPGKMFKLPIVGWGLQCNGEVVGLVPWLNRISACPTLIDPLNGHWEGYFSAINGDVFYEAPSYKVTELQAAYDYYSHSRAYFEAAHHDARVVIQEIPDQVGTHAVFTDTVHKAVYVRAVFSWQLHGNGHIAGMLVNPAKIKNTPVLTGDEALYSANSCADFRYFFQYGIANKIKTKDPDAIKAMSALIDA